MPNMIYKPFKKNIFTPAVKSKHRVKKKCPGSGFSHKEFGCTWMHCTNIPAILKLLLTKQKLLEVPDSPDKDKYAT